MKYQFLKKPFFIFILVNICLVIFWLDIKHLVENDSSISEWLINYQGGFTRRGLGGEIAMIFANLLSQNRDLLSEEVLKSDIEYHSLINVYL